MYGRASKSYGRRVAEPVNGVYMAKFYFYYGQMGSSKTANALMTHFNYEEFGQKALLCNPKIDNRFGEKVVK